MCSFVYLLSVAASMHCYSHYVARSRTAAAAAIVATNAQLWKTHTHTRMRARKERKNERRQTAASKNKNKNKNRDNTNQFKLIVINMLRNGHSIECCYWNNVFTDWNRVIGDRCSSYLALILFPLWFHFINILLALCNYFSHFFWLDYYFITRYASLGLHTHTRST